MNPSGILRGCFYANLVIGALAFANSGYNLVKFNNISEVSRLSMQDNGVFRNYRDRREITQDIRNKEQKISAQKYLNSFDKSNAVLAVSGLVAISSGLAFSSMRNKSN
ncbi:MAG: hypothetical protein WC979_06035 [Candidatus Pacearchaeota archaeon]|jgi:hypothetical protein